MLKNKIAILLLGCILVFGSIFIVLNNDKKNKFDIDTVKLELPIDTKTSIKIPLKKISLLYNELTDGMNLTNETDIGLLKYQFDRIDPIFIYSKNDDYYFILNYDCGVKLCHYMLVNYNGTTTESLYLNSGLLKDFKCSADNDKVLINFMEPEGGTELSNEVILVDINNMKIIDLPSLSETYTYIVDSYDWENNKLIIKYKEKESEEIKTFINE